MRYCIFGDSHGNLEGTTAVIADGEKQSSDEWVFLGDAVGYCANPNETLDLIYSKVPTKNIFRGNHDAQAIHFLDFYRANKFWPTLSGWNPLALEAIQWTAENLSPQSEKRLEALLEPDRILDIQKDTTKRLLFTHDTPLSHSGFNYITCWLNAKRFFFEDSNLSNNTIAFVGHTHIPQIYLRAKGTDAITDIDPRQINDDYKIDLSKYGSALIVIPSAGQPRDWRNKVGYALYDSSTGILNIKRVEYDYQTTQQKIIDKCLPRELADRLSSGR